MEAIQQLIEQVLQEKGGDLVQSLVSQLGFDANTAQQFVPAAIGQLGQALGGGGGGGFDLAGLLGNLGGGGDLSGLLDQVNVGALASEAGTSETEAKQGLEALAPQVLDALGQQAGGADGLLSALGGGDAGGLLGAASKLGGLLGK